MVSTLMTLHVIGQWFLHARQKNRYIEPPTAQGVAPVMAIGGGCGVLALRPTDPLKLNTEVGPYQCLPQLHVACVASIREPSGP